MTEAAIFNQAGNTQEMGRIIGTLLTGVVGLLSAYGQSIVQPIERTREDGCSCLCNYGEFKTSSGGFRLAFKAVAGNGRSVIDDFLKGGDINMDVPNADVITSEFPYRDSDILDNWDKLYIDQVKVEVLTGGTRNAWFLFNGAGADIDGWLKQSRLLASPYNDVATTEFNYFDIYGHKEVDRYFFINKFYDGCPGDCGWLAVVEAESGTCPWDRMTDIPYFLYGRTTDECTVFEVDGIPADRFVIYVKIVEV